MLVDTALHAYSMVSVPLYDTLGPEAVRYILSHAELQAIACSLAVLPTLLQCLPECPNVKIVVSGKAACWACIRYLFVAVHVSYCIVVARLREKAS